MFFLLLDCCYKAEHYFGKILTYEKSCTPTLSAIHTRNPDHCTLCLCEIKCASGEFSSYQSSMKIIRRKLICVHRNLLLLTERCKKGAISSV